MERDRNKETETESDEKEKDGQTETDKNRHRYKGVHPPKPMMHIGYSHYLRKSHVFASPYFEHDAFMHHALHVLDVPVQITETMTEGHSFWYKRCECDLLFKSTINSSSVDRLSPADSKYFRTSFINT